MPPSLPLRSPAAAPLGSGPGPADAPFGPNVRVSDLAGNQNEITIAVASDGRIHEGWNDYRAPNPDYRCGYSYSTDNGATWSANQLLHLAGFGADGDPMIVVDANNNVYFFCLAFNRGGGAAIAVHRSTDGGVTFLPPVVVSDTGDTDKEWAIAVGNTIHVCYADFGFAPVQIRYTRSTDGGATWAPTRTLGVNGNGCQFAADNVGNLYLSWAGFDDVIYARHSPDGGTTWGSAALVASAPWTSLGNPRAYTLPSMTADTRTGAVYIVWHDLDAVGGYDVRFSASTDQGFTWTAPVTVNDISTGRQYMPAIGVSPNGVLNVAWYDTRTGLDAVRYAYSSDGGATWSASTRVTDTEFSDNTPFIGDYIATVADPFGFVDVGWCDVRTGDNDAYFARTTAPAPHLAAINVTPPSASTDADTSVSFTATGYDQYGRVFPTNPVWEATGGTTLGNTYVPSLAGDWTIWANDSGVSGQAAIHVIPGALARLEIAPANATVPADQTLQYTATGYDAHGNPFPASPAWGVSDGSISSSGLFTPRHMGTWTVYANESGITATTSVTVVPGALAAITVVPDNVTITADMTQPYIALGFDIKGNSVAVTPTWEATGGSIDASGVYAAVRAGRWGVWANESGISGTTAVNVVPGALARIDVVPKDRTISADQTLQYNATGYDAKGNVVPIAPVWTAQAGSIDAVGGLYTPGRVGTWAINATVGSVVGSTSVTVRVGPLARIDVTPTPSTITADDTLALTAQGFDIRGNSLPIAPTWAASCGSVSQAGLYSPGPARLCLVYANQSGISGVAEVTVTAGQLARIDVTPAVVTITADETATFTATGYDAHDNPLPITPTWTAERGAISAGGLYTPTPVGTWAVQASQSGIVGTAHVTVTEGALVRLGVVPPSVTITADQTATFQAFAYDRADNAVPVPSATWAVANGSISAQGVFTPRGVGRWLVTATSGALQGFANATVLPGAVASVELQPPSGHIGEGTSLGFTAKAFDAKGNEVPNATFTWRVDGAIGQIDGAGMFTATHGGQGQVVVTANGGGGTATKGAAMTVDASLLSTLANPVVLIPLILVLVLVPLLLVVLWRRRKRNEPTEKTE